MAERALSNPTIEIDNEIISIIPGTFGYKKGTGDKVVTVESAGGNSVEIIVTDNAETKKSSAKFSLKSTIKHIDHLATWSNAPNGVSIRASELEHVENFNHMFITTEPTIETGADASFEVMFEGAPAK